MHNSADQVTDTGEAQEAATRGDLAPVASAAPPGASASATMPPAAAVLCIGRAVSSLSSPSCSAVERPSGAAARAERAPNSSAYFASIAASCSGDRPSGAACDREHAL
jgi:hypothetical protein